MNKNGMKVLVRIVREVPFDKWMDNIRMEKNYDELLGEFGFGQPRRYRAMFGAESTNTRVSQILCSSFGELADLTGQWMKKDQLQRFEAERQKTFLRERHELFFVDSGSPVPIWMQRTSKNPIDPQYLNCCANDNTLVPETPEELQKCREEGKIRLMYRLIQEVPREHWAEKLAQEHASDELERGMTPALPLRYRAMFGTERSHTRVHEREYQSYSEIAYGWERFIFASDENGVKLEKQEHERQVSFRWEREELYWVDTDSAIPQWMEIASELKNMR